MLVASFCFTYSMFLFILMSWIVALAQGKPLAYKFVLWLIPFQNFIVFIYSRDNRLLTFCLHFVVMDCFAPVIRSLFCFKLLISIIYMCIKFDFNTLLLFYCLSVIAVGSYAEELIKKWKKEKRRKKKGGGGGGSVKESYIPIPSWSPPLCTVPSPFIQIRKIKGLGTDTSMHCIVNSFQVCVAGMWLHV